MTSKEALNRLYNLALPSSSPETWEHRNRYCSMLYDIIKQDLEEYEEIKKYGISYGNFKKKEKKNNGKL